MRVELAIQDLAGIRLASRVHPDRIELCSGLALGGLTPSIGLIEEAVAAREGGGPKVHVLIRPRTGGFAFDRDEVALMKRDIARAVDAGADGVVIGAAAYTDDGATRLDLDVTEELAAAAGPARVVLHRVIDTVADPVASARSVAELESGAIDIILTSGGAPKAPDGADVLAAMVAAVGTRVEIMAGSGMRAETIGAVASTGVAAVHGSVSRVGEVEVPEVLGASGQASRRIFTDEAAAAAFIAAAHSLGA